MQRTFLAGLTGVLILLCYVPAMPGLAPIAESIVRLSRPFHQPTVPIYELLHVIEQHDQVALQTTAARLHQPAALRLLIDTWRQVHQPPMIVLGPYRTPDWPLPGTRLDVPLQLTCHHGKVRFEITVILTAWGWQVTDIRLPQQKP
ncbi:hypothetical protein [Chloroflexus aurantiacus]